MRIFGSDFETWHGEPRLFTSYDGREEFCAEVNTRTVLPTVLEYVRSRALKRQVNTMWFHGLHHDFVCLLYAFPQAFHETRFTITYEGVQIEAFFHHRVFGYIRFPDSTVVRLIDSTAFFPEKLEELAVKLDLPIQKMKRPKDIGKVNPVKYKQYAIVDAKTEYHLARYITDLHREYDVRQAVSAPDLASKIFRHHFLGEKRMAEPRKILYPPHQWVDMLIQSYRGGKNGLYVQPGFYKNVVYADVVSAYPWAMTKIPSLLEGDGAYKTVHKFAGANGVYRVWGTAKCAHYTVFYGDKFQPLFGTIKAYIITGPELEAALQHKIFFPERIEGVVWEPKKKPSGYLPLAEYAHDFFKRKESAPKSDPRHYFYKLMLNSFYGKFMQRVPIQEAIYDFQSDAFIDRQYQVGGLFNPFVGTLITGWARALMFRHEVKYSALHTATDSIMTRKKVRDEGSSLGSLQPQYHGDVLILRNKLYVMFESGTDTVINYALHGFHGTVHDLLRLWKKRKHEYKILHMNRIKESLRRGLVPLLFNEQKRTLEIDWESLRK